MTTTSTFKDDLCCKYWCVNILSYSILGSFTDHTRGKLLPAVISTQSPVFWCFGFFFLMDLFYVMFTRTFAFLKYTATMSFWFDLTSMSILLKQNNMSVHEPWKPPWLQFCAPTILLYHSLCEIILHNILVKSLKQKPWYFIFPRGLIVAQFWTIQILSKCMQDWSTQLGLIKI